MQTILVPETLHPGGLELTKRAIELCSPRPGERLVDLGCGSGAAVLFASREYGLQAAGFDLRLEALLDAASLFSAAQLVAAQVRSLPLAAESCDILLAECSLSAMGNLAGVLSECRRVLVPGGHLAITDLYRRAPAFVRAVLHAGPDGGLVSRHDRTRPPDQSGWISHLENSGFDVLCWEDHTPALTAMAAEAIFSGRSLASLWGCPDGGPDVSAGTVSQLRLGYCLVTAEKPAAAGGFAETYRQRP